MQEPDKYRDLIGRTLATHVHELLEIIREEKAYTFIMDNGEPQLTFPSSTLRRVLDHIEQAWSDIHEASSTKATVLKFRKFSPEHIEQVKP